MKSKHEISDLIYRADKIIPGIKEELKISIDEFARLMFAEWYVDIQILNTGKYNVVAAHKMNMSATIFSHDLTEQVMVYYAKLDDGEINKKYTQKLEHSFDNSKEVMDYCTNKTTMMTKALSMDEILVDLNIESEKLGSHYSSTIKLK